MNHPKNLSNAKVNMQNVMFTTLYPTGLMPYPHYIQMLNTCQILIAAEIHTTNPMRVEINACIT